jgi:WD40 repeat protein
MRAPCCPPQDVLRSFHLGTLPDGPLAEVTAHVAGCARCEAVLQKLEATTDPLLAALHRQEPLPDDTLHTAGGTQTPAGLPDVPGYEVLGVLGEGGMGVVYKARNRRLGRDVALKRLRAAGEAHRERFQAEALAAARLQHPNIVAVYEVFDHDGDQYLALELVEGGSLEQVTGTPLSPRQAAELVEALARAVQHAHERGVVHRDLKPANVLLAVGPDSNPVGEKTGLESYPTKAVPKVTDFGIARHLAAGPRRTQEGDVIGTPAYMAPEQAAGRTAAVGPAADVYSLGVLLYELLTGRPPFQGETLTDTLLQVVHLEPVPVRRLQPRVPRDLETIVLKCLQKEPAGRYASAEALADDLRRFREGQTIVARPAGLAERAWKWSRRRPLVAALLLVVVAVTALGAAGVAGALVYALDGWQQARLNEGAAVRAGDEARALRDASRLRSARLTLDKGITLAEQGDVARGLHFMRESLVLAPDDAGDLRRLARINLGAWGTRLHGLRLILGHTEEVKAAAFSPDGKTLVTGSAAGQAQRWDAVTGRPIGEPLRAPGWVWAVAYRPDGKVIATAGGTPAGGRGDLNCGVQFWDADSGEPAGPPLSHTRRVWCVGYHPDGRTVATGSDRTVRLWDVAAGKLVRQLDGHSDDVHGVAFSPDGRVLASAGDDHTVRLWDADTGRLLHVLRGHTQQVRGVAFHPDGRRVASAGQDGTARLWDAAGGQGVGEPLRHPAPVETLAFTPDGMTLVTGCYDGNARLWDLGTGQPWGSTLEHRLRVTSVAVSGDGRAVLTGSLDRTARLWEVGRGLSRPAGLVRGAEPGAPWFQRAVYSPDRAVVVTAGTHGLAQVWDAATGRAIEVPLRHPDPDVRACVFSPDGKTLATACLREGVLAGKVRLWDPATGRPRSDWLSHPDYVGALAFSPDGRTLATGDYHFDVRLWDVATGQVRAGPWPQRDIVLSLAFSPDGRTLAAGTANSWHRDPQARLWDVATGRPRGDTIRHQHWVHFLAFSPDGKALLTGSRDGTARLWDAATGRPLSPPLPHQFEWMSAAFSPDGRTVLTGGMDGVGRLWRTADGQPAGPPLRHPAGVETVAFSPDGRSLLVGCRDGGARLWDAGTSIPLGPELGQGRPLLAVGFAADGETLFTTADDGSARSWPVPGPLEGDEESLALWLQVRTGLAMAADDQALAPLDAEAWEARRRRLGERPGPSAEDGAWHEARAREAEQEGDLFAAGWHLDRLARLRPRDGLVFARRGGLRVAEGRLEEAAADYRRAEELAGPDALATWYRAEEAAWRLRGRADAADWYAGRASSLGGSRTGPPG